MKILLIGGTGTLSKAVRDELLNNTNHDVIVLHRGHRELPLHPHLREIKADIHDPKLADILKDEAFDVVVHFVLYHPDEVSSMMDVFKHRCKQFVYISTVATLDHDHHFLISESTPTGNKQSTYGQNKAEAEKRFLESSHFPVTIIRPAQTYSDDRIPLSIKPKQCWPVIERMLNHKPVIIHGDGQSLWASMHASDFAKALVPLLGNLSTVREIIHIQNPQAHRWMEVYEDLAELLNVPLYPITISSQSLVQTSLYDLQTSLVGDKMYSNLYDISKLKKFNPEFTSKIDLKTGLQMYLDYMNEHPELKQSDPQFDQWCDRMVEVYSQFNQNLQTIKTDV